MYNIPNAEISPRIVNGVIRWYQGDTFDIQLTIELEDQDGEAVILGEDDTVSITFRNQSDSAVKTFTFTELEGNTVTMDFDSTCTALFGRGNYSYTVTITHGERTTIASENKVVVE